MHQHGTLEIACDFAQRGVGVLTILHDLNLAAQYADRIMMMHQGRCLALGTPHDIFTPENIHMAFDMPVLVENHPCLNCPLIIAIPLIKEKVTS